MYKWYKSVNVCGVRIAIKYVKQIPGDIDAVGAFDLDKRVIYIKAGLPERLRRCTFLHEFVHAALGVTGLSNILEDQTEEAVVVALEHGLEGLLKQLK